MKLSKYLTDDTIKDKTNFKPDDRKLTWEKLEATIQSRATKKDNSFILKGPWKKFIKTQAGFDIYSVDNEWVKNNLSVIFGHGGHGYVHEFIPMNEIWILHVNDEYSQEYFDSCAAHEIKEFLEMKKGMKYWKAHQIALTLEKELGLISSEEINK